MIDVTRSKKHRRDHRQRRAINRLEEDIQGQLEHHLGDLLGELHGRRQTWNEGLNVRVGVGAAQGVLGDSEKISPPVR
jgi:hypothetical protein